MYSRTNPDPEPHHVADDMLMATTWFSEQAAHHWNLVDKQSRRAGGATRDSVYTWNELKHTWEASHALREQDEQVPVITPYSIPPKQSDKTDRTRQGLDPPERDSNPLRAVPHRYTESNAHSDSQGSAEEAESSTTLAGETGLHWHHGRLVDLYFEDVGTSLLWKYIDPNACRQFTGRCSPSLALSSFEPQRPNQLELVGGREVMIIWQHGRGWLLAYDATTGKQGFVPDSNMLLTGDIPYYDPEIGNFIGLKEEPLGGFPQDKRTQELGMGFVEMSRPPPHTAKQHEEPLFSESNKAVKDSEYGNRSAVNAQRVTLPK